MNHEEAQFVRRRRVPRREFVRRVGLLVHGEFNLNQALQLGEGGMLIESIVPLKAEQQVVISFRLPRSAFLVARATVKYIMDPDEDSAVPRYGLQFDNVDFGAKRLIRNFVASKEVEEDTSTSNDPVTL